MKGETYSKFPRSVSVNIKTELDNDLSWTKLISIEGLSALCDGRTLEGLLIEDVG